MSNYINRDDALGIVTRAFEASEVVDGSLPARFQLAVVLKCLNDLEPVDLVRCGECRYLMGLRSESAAEKFGQIYECRKQIINSPNPSRFCSYGERK